MNRVQFIIVTTLSGIVALCIFCRSFMSGFWAPTRLALRDTEQALQAGPKRLQPPAADRHAGRPAGPAAERPALRDLLTRQNIQIKANADEASSPAPAPAAPAPATPSTR